MMGMFNSAQALAIPFSRMSVENMENSTSTPAIVATLAALLTLSALTSDKQIPPTLPAST